MFNVIFLLTLWVTAQAGLPMGDIPEPPDSEAWEFEEFAYPCFTAMICIHKSTRKLVISFSDETHNKFSECMLPDMPEKHVRKAVYFVNPGELDTSPYKSLYDFHARTFCSVNVEERGGCMRNDDPEFCTSWEDIIAALEVINNIPIEAALIYADGRKDEFEQTGSEVYVSLRLPLRRASTDDLAYSLASVWIRLEVT
ncbi:hypothetical protein TNIN_93891 [Trichonephila inaurata madagascariensis]|uniref:Secreted protein n=1 Tax=Trichonephila inaurata madagascariensis TaxID=2747483 RepID=A0A8X6YNQ8_9ARAC|nr:hypothetical protein TNIN_93891 [Trichonephila inaurata madagascariensis]